MTDEQTPAATVHVHKGSTKIQNNSVNGGIYGMAFIGALIYFIQHSIGFWGIIWGILKAIFWPAFLIYKLLEFLNM